MVTAGFIVEGGSEAVLIKDEFFINFLHSLNITCNKELVINAGGKNNLYNPAADLSKLERRVSGWTQILRSKGAEIIILLLDFDNSDLCFTEFKSKIYTDQNSIVIVAKHALEAWYLADHTALSVYIGKSVGIIGAPESYNVPFDEVRVLRKLYSEKGKGIADKKSLAKHMLKSGFSLPRAAAHPNCPSAAYFLKKLQSLYTP